MAHQVATTPSEAVSSPRPVSANTSGASGAERRGGMRRTYGALDLGTNNCRLLIARPSEGGFTVVDAFSRIVRLGEGLGATGAPIRPEVRRWHREQARPGRDLILVEPASLTTGVA